MTPTMTAKEDDLLWNAQQTSKFLGVHENTLRRMIRDGRLPYIYLGDRMMRFLKKDVIAWLENQRRGWVPGAGTRAIGKRSK